jgi:CheY-like chemotaxis protein
LARHLQIQKPGMARVLVASGVHQALPRGLFAAHAAKPIRRTQLQEMLQAALQAPHSVDDETLADGAALTPARNLRILVVEDNPINALVVRSMLERCGQTSDLAGNGIEAIDAVRRQPYDLIFMDMLMPDMDGLQAARAIRSLNLTPQPYIAALTANVMAEDQEACIAAGMNEFLGKPVKLPALQECVARVAAQ